MKLRNKALDGIKRLVGHALVKLGRKDAEKARLRWKRNREYHEEACMNATVHPHDCAFKKWAKLIKRHSHQEAVRLVLADRMSNKQRRDWARAGKPLHEHVCSRLIPTIHLEEKPS